MYLKLSIPTCQKIDNESYPLNFIASMWEYFLIDAINNYWYPIKKSSLQCVQEGRTENLAGCAKGFGWNRTAL